MPHQLKEYKIEKSKEQKTTEEIEQSELSTFQGAQVVKYDADQIKRLGEEIFEEFEAIKRERDNENLDAFFEAADNQYKGRMPRRAGNQFNLDCGLTKIKENDFVRSAMAAHWGVDPILSVGPRPAFAKEGGSEVCEKQEEFLDYSFDMRIPFRNPFRKAAHSAARKRCGLIKWIHKIITEPKIRREIYKPDMEERPNPQGPDFPPIRVNKGLENFLRIHTEEVQKNPEKYKWIADRLNAGKPVTLDVEYPELIYNDPFPKFIENKNFYVRLATQGYEGLITTRLTVERVEFTYYELKKFEKEYNFVDLDELLYDDDKSVKGRTVRKGAYNEKYDIFECVYYFNESNKVDDELMKVVCFFSEKKKLFHGGVYFPFTTLQCYYVPHYINQNELGFYQGSMSEDLRDLHISKNAILNFTLEGAWASNIVTPITPEDSAVDIQFANKKWMHGLPLNADPKDVAFLNTFMKPVNVRDLLLLNNELGRTADDISGISSLRTGRESPLDPSAPGNKTLALLEQSGVNVQDYIVEMSKGFNIDASCVLRIYFEISQNDILYVRRRARKVTGEEPFAAISKSDLIAKTTIQSQAHIFDIDKLNAKREDLAFYQIMRPEAMVAGNPEAVWILLRNLAKNWSQKWRNKIDQILPTLESLKIQQAQVAMQAVTQYVQIKMKEAEATNQPLKFNPEELIGMVAQSLKEMVSPTPEKERR